MISKTGHSTDLGLLLQNQATAGHKIKSNAGTHENGNPVLFLIELIKDSRSILWQSHCWFSDPPSPVLLWLDTKEVKVHTNLPTHSKERHIMIQSCCITPRKKKRKKNLATLWNCPRTVEGDKNDDDIRSYYFISFTVAVLNFWSNNMWIKIWCMLKMCCCCCF